jgi:hypothetical protein
LEVLLIGRQPKAGWTRPTLEQACGVSVGTLDDHLAALVALGLLEHDEGTFTVRASRSQLVEALRVVLRQTARTPDRPAQPLPRRRYTQRSQGSS